MNAEYTPLVDIASSKDDDNNMRFDYSSAFNWTSDESLGMQRNSSRINYDPIENKKYNSIFTYNSASLTLNVDHLNEGSTTFTRKRNDDFVSLITHCLIVFWCYAFVIITSPISAWFYVKRIAPNERAILFRLGRLKKIRGPGLTYFLPWIDRWKKIDLRMRAFVIPPQHVIMTDGAIVEIGSEIRFRICDVVKSVTGVKDLDHSVRLLGKTTMINLLQSKNLSEFTNEKISICSKILADLNVATQPWGIEISLVEFSTPKILKEGGDSSPINNIVSCLQSAFNLPKTDDRPFSKVPEAKSAGKSLPEDNGIRTVLLTKIFPALDKIFAEKQHIETGAIYEILVIGDQSATCWIDTETGTWSEEKSPSGWRSPDVTVRLSDEDFLNFIEGNLSPFQGYISGRVSVTGDARLLLELQKLIAKIE